MEIKLMEREHLCTSVNNPGILVKPELSLSIVWVWGHLP